jgi:hypothetical protein
MEERKLFFFCGTHGQWHLTCIPVHSTVMALPEMLTLRLRGFALRSTYSRSAVAVAVTPISDGPRVGDLLVVLVQHYLCHEQPYEMVGED